MNFLKVLLLQYSLSFFHFQGIWSQRQQAMQGTADICLPSNMSQLLLGNPEASKGRWNISSLQQVLGLLPVVFPVGPPWKTSKEKHLGGILINTPPYNHLCWLLSLWWNSGSFPSSFRCLTSLPYLKTRPSPEEDSRFSHLCLLGYNQKLGTTCEGCNLCLPTQLFSLTLSRIIPVLQLMLPISNFIFRSLVAKTLRNLSRDTILRFPTQTLFTPAADPISQGPDTSFPSHLLQLSQGRGGGAERYNLSSMA